MLRFRQENLSPSLHSKGRCSHPFLYVFSWTLPFSLSPSYLSVSEETNGFRYDSMQSLLNLTFVLQMSQKWEKSVMSVCVSLSHHLWDTCVCSIWFSAEELPEWCRLILAGCQTPTQLLYNSPSRKDSGRKQARKAPLPVTVMFKIALTQGKLIKYIVN